MEADLQSQVAFFLTGQKQAPQLEDISKHALRPALLAGFGDLTHMRYDFPVVLVDTPDADYCIQPLSGVIDGILARVAVGTGADRIRKHVLRLEREIRSRAANGATGRLAELWDTAAKSLGENDKALAANLAHARANLAVDGALVDCNAALPYQLVGHAWNLTQRRHAERFNEDIDRLIVRLSEILEADFINSDAGRSADRLKNSLGAGALASFNYEAMSAILKKATARESLPAERRSRIEALIATLSSQRFYATSRNASQPEAPYSFAFDSCNAALEAYRERLPKAVELAKAIAIAELEIKGEYSEKRHGALFKAFGENGLDTAELALFPDYFVHINAAALTGSEQGTLTEILSADLPFKILVQSDDILEKSLIEHGHLAFTLRNKQLARMAMGMGVFVLQAPASSLYRMRSDLQRGLDSSGASLLSVYSGDSPHTAGIPPYLVSAAARESRLLPAFCFAPSAGRDWASRFTLTENPQLANDWTTHDLIHQDERCQTAHLPMPFTMIDFVALDSRYAKHFALAPKARWNSGMVPVTEMLMSERRSQIETVPYIMMIDGDHVLQRVLVDEKLVREARRCRSMWNSLQELGGINNSHATRLLEAERARWALESRPVGETTVAIEAKAPAASAAPQPTEPDAAHSPDEAYIETPRCASCNECIQINDKLFAYDGNKQAFIADIKAGTFAQLVEAAENCQVAIIHPGKPRNPGEAGLEELIKRAEAFA